MTIPAVDSLIQYKGCDFNDEWTVATDYSLTGLTFTGWIHDPQTNEPLVIVTMTSNPTTHKITLYVAADDIVDLKPQAYNFFIKHTDLALIPVPFVDGKWIIKRGDAWTAPA